MRNIVLVVILFLFSSICYGQDKAVKETPKHDTEQCKALHDEIENDFTQANYCKQDSDCETVKLASVYIEFGCYKYVNKATDKEAIDKKLKKYYNEKCFQAIDMCAHSPEPICINKRCVQKEPSSNNEVRPENKSTKNLRVSGDVTVSTVDRKGF